MIRREEGSAQIRGAASALAPAPAPVADADDELAAVAPGVVPPASAPPGEEIH